jgi:hypothetical protein
MTVNSASSSFSNPTKEMFPPSLTSDSGISLSDFDVLKAFP